MSTKLPFAIQMARESGAKKIEHFKTVQLRPGEGEIKIFNTDIKVFVVALDARRTLTDFIVIHRRPNTSLLGVQGAIEETIRRGTALVEISQQLSNH